MLTARSGAEALRIAATEKPDLILLDVVMPKMSGHEVIIQLRADPKTVSIPVVFLTAKGEIDDKLDGYELGAVGYVTKPIDRNFLLETVAERVC